MHLFERRLKVAFQELHRRLVQLQGQAHGPEAGTEEGREELSRDKVQTQRGEKMD